MSTRVPLRGKDIPEESMVRAEAPGTVLYRRFVRFLLPVEFRERHEEELVWVFSELFMEARTRKGSRGRTTIWLREMPALLRLAWRVRRRGEAPARSRSCQTEGPDAERSVELPRDDERRRSPARNRRTRRRAGPAKR